MRFAIATSDGYQCVLEALLAGGWELQALFVSPGDHLNGTGQVIARALALGADVRHSPMTADDLAALGRQGCDLLLVASYAWRIPPWQERIPYAVNLHPSPLPEGRGPYPLVRAILENRRQWAVTAHAITDVLDGGDILDAESFPIADDESHESLCLKVQMAGRPAGRPRGGRAAAALVRGHAAGRGQLLAPLVGAGTYDRFRAAGRGHHAPHSRLRRSRMHGQRQRRQPVHPSSPSLATGP